MVGLVTLGCAACAAPLQRTVKPQAAPPAEERARGVSDAGRPTVGVAFGGGSARGIAHVGVIRWLEEHRIPIDVAAGTSMGGLVGGAFATGMDAAELQTFITDPELGSAVRRVDVRATRTSGARPTRARIPSRLEFGLKGGIVPPTALNSGQDVELLLGRIAAPYFEHRGLRRPADAVSNRRRRSAVGAAGGACDSGSLADAMRATMSLPLIFPPVEVDGQVLIDGGTMNNVPADVVKAMGADRVVAVNVGDLSDREGLSYTMLGVAGEYARRDDARVDPARHRRGRRRHQRAARRVRLARLAARRRR